MAVVPVPTKPPFWHDPRIRALIFQIIILVAVFAFFFYIFGNALHNLEKRGISTGFDFLSTEAGFGIIQTLIEYNESSTYGHTFVVGLLNTILVSALGIAFATLLGFIIGIARLSHNWLVAKLAAAYIEIFRNIPLLLQIFFWYFVVLRALPSPRQSWAFGDLAFLNIRGLYLPLPELEFSFIWVAFFLVLVFVWAKRPVFYFALLLVLPLFWLAPWDVPQLKGFNFQGGITVIPELMALLIALSIYTAAFIAEIVRSGIQGVNYGQTEAAQALGLRQSHTLRLVIIPQAMRIIIPPLTSQYLNLTKNSSLATAIGYPDLVAVFAGTTLNQTGQAVEVIAMTMAVYLTLSLSISLLMNWYNRKMMLVER
ncbi:amino acid ABC transporter permease [Candidatus Thiomargarita nelsonii]|uniref:Amino acid ABC transporter permease n=1 Tax=Candidatus Thiomargarita nelsonii TaxID=1003181 RepID=A0A0A6PFX0_9GAMM|nr:amino acid ABC transporter permease [Candidatus Thiomargarita nelsonii]